MYVKPILGLWFPPCAFLQGIGGKFVEFSGFGVALDPPVPHVGRVLVEPSAELQKFLIGKF
jgi:hypothetical protein